MAFDYQILFDMSYQICYVGFLSLDLRRSPDVMGVEAIMFAPQEVRELEMNDVKAKEKGPSAFTRRAKKALFLTESTGIFAENGLNNYFTASLILLLLISRRGRGVQRLTV